MTFTQFTAYAFWTVVIVVPVIALLNSWTVRR